MSSAIYQGVRNTQFKNFISELLKRGNVSDKFMHILTSDENMKLYGTAFTSSTADVNNNYEMYEQLGDVCANQFIVYYMYERFPQLKCTKGVKVAARLRINYGSKETFTHIAESLGFWEYISSTIEERSTNKKDLLEDTFEAFCGVTSSVVNDATRQGIGFPIVYDILESVFNDMDISLAYDDLYDSKTRLKEIFDLKRFSDILGKLKYTCEKNATGVNVVTATANGNIIGVGTAYKKADAEQKAAAEGIKKVNSMGYIREPPLEYKLFCNVP
jgi:dsRNA-specific ribonuclease